MRTAPATSLPHRGFTLIELMVAMALALMTTVIIAEVMLKSEGNRRTTTEGSDAQLNGALALYAVQRDITMAGYGIISNNTVLGCEVRAQYGGNLLPKFTLAPVKIDANASPAVSDTVTILRSGTTSYAIPITLTGAHNTADTIFTVQSTLGVATGDMLLAMPTAFDASNWCTIFAATSVPSSTTISHTAASNSWNPSASIMPAVYASGSSLAKVSQMVYRSFAISNSNLVATDLITATGGTSANTVGTQIVLLKAYYGVAAGTDGVVTSYTTTTPTTNADWLKVRTIRIALVARSAQREKDAVTNTNPAWDVGNMTISGGTTSTCGSSKCLTLQVSPASGNDAEWKHYRYKVFDTVIPLRNMFWTS